MVEGAGVLVLLAVLLLPSLWQRHLRETRQQSLRAIAADHEGWSYDEGVLQGRIGATSVALRTSMHSYDQAFTVEVVPDHGAVPLQMGRLTDKQRSERSRVQTGDASFDAEVHVSGSAGLALAMLTPEAREAALFAVRAGWTFDGERWSRYFPKLVAKRPELEQHLAVAWTLAGAQVPTSELLTALEQRLQTEVDPRVRLEIARARVELPEPLPVSLANDLLAPRDACSLLVARHLGADGTEWLFELALESSDLDVRWQAIGYLAKHYGDPRLGAALVPFLDGPLAGAAIERLQRAGTVAQVAPLRAIAERWFDAHGQAAEKAIAAIQARAGHRAGQLSIVEERPEAGAVSIAKRAARGRVPEG